MQRNRKRVNVGKNQVRMFFFLKAVDKLFELLVRITEAELIKSGLH